MDDNTPGAAYLDMGMRNFALAESQPDMAAPSGIADIANACAGLSRGSARAGRKLQRVGPDHYVD